MVRVSVGGNVQRLPCFRRELQAEGSPPAQNREARADTRNGLGANRLA